MFIETKIDQSIDCESINNKCLVTKMESPFLVGKNVTDAYFFSSKIPPPLQAHLHSILPKMQIYRNLDDDVVAIEYVNLKENANGQLDY